MPNILSGVVTKTGAMRKTVTVTISRTFEHPKLLKPIHRTTKMLVHDEAEETRIGDRVTILHGKPFSKRKHFRIQSIDYRHEVPQAKTQVEQALGEAQSAKPAESVVDKQES